MVDAIIFRVLLSLAISKGLYIHRMIVVITYLQGSLDRDIYMKIPEGLKVPKVHNSKAQEMCSIKL